MSGFLDLGTGPERQEIIVRKALEIRAAQWTREGYAYRGGGDLMLQHGKFFSGRRLPDQYAHLLGAEGQCFWNAMDACEADSSLAYWQGVYTVGAGHYTPHAWCTDPAGELVEVTFPTDPETLGRLKIIGQPASSLPPPLDRWGYWGVQFKIEYVKAVWGAEETACVPGDGEAFHGSGSLLDRPVQDGADGLADDRDDWIVLRKPYDLERTEP